jgi:hypothetical protein
MAKALKHLLSPLKKVEKSEAQKLNQIREAAFKKGQRMAARAVAKADGHAAGMKAAKKRK